MQPFPHHYTASASAAALGEVALRSDGLPDIVSAAPTEFGGPGDRWSPETLLVAAVADCNVSGTVDRVDRVTQFTELRVRARLRLPPGTNEDQARRLLTKAEETCLVTNSMKVRPHIEALVEFEGP
jgi:organic hydroperoxide reductase OsmC/OhrA